MRRTPLQGRARRCATAFIALGCTVAAAAAVASRLQPKIVVLGEVQAAAETASALLKRLELVDESGRWTGGDTILVQTGDLVDRGEKVRDTLDLFMRLQQEAATAGGEVVVLMGNHEVMNILRESKYVNYMAYQDFAGPDSKARQDDLYARHVACRQRRAEALGLDPFEPGEQYHADFVATHPLGWVEYFESMRPEGKYGSWLRSLPVAHQIDDLLFIHAGVSPEMRDSDLQAINRCAAAEIASFDGYSELMVANNMCQPTASVREMAELVAQEIDFVNSLPKKKRTDSNPRVAQLLELQQLTKLSSWSVLTVDGPLWFRGVTMWNENDKAREMKAILDSLGVRRMITGQGLEEERVITARFDNRVLLTSVDLADGPYGGGGKPAALEIDKGVYSVVTLDARDILINQ
jgi:hypothetical protein